MSGTPICNCAGRPGPLCASCQAELLAGASGEQGATPLEFEHDALRARVAELEAMLKGVVEANHAQRARMEAASAELRKLLGTLASAREAITNVLRIAVPDDELLARANEDPVWRHVAPAYSVEELAQRALEQLRRT